MADVPLPVIAEEWGIHPSNVRRYAIKKGIKLRKVLDPSRGGQRVLVFSEVDAERLRRARQEESIAL